MEAELEKYREAYRKWLDEAENSFGPEKDALEQAAREAQAAGATRDDLRSVRLRVQAEVL